MKPYIITSVEANYTGITVETIDRWIEKGGNGKSLLPMKNISRHYMVIGGLYAQFCGRTGKINSKTVGAIFPKYNNHGRI
jgi:hypothetical protein